MKPTDAITTAIEAIAEGWEKEAGQRAARTPSDPAATTLQSCAAELRERLAVVERDTAYLTVARFAAHRGLTESTVRRLCARGELEGAERGLAGEWQIPRDAKRVQRVRQSA